MHSEPNNGAIAMQALADRIAQFAEEGESHETEVPGLALFRRDSPSEPRTGIYEPSICLVAQGAKRVELGEDVYVYDARHYLLTSVHLPTVVQVTDASPAKPYLGLRLTLNLQEVAQLMADSKLPAPRSQQSRRGMTTGEIGPALLNAFLSLVDLLGNRQDIPILAPLIQREIIYRLLVGEQGARLRQIAAAGSQSQQIAHAIEWIKSNFTRPLRIEDLAAQARMSASTFHHHFRAMTALSPVQYQKQLRLQEARRLMLSDRLDASTAGYRVGYESASQFSRDYSRHFGAPPLRDINGLREAATQAAV